MSLLDDLFVRTAPPELVFADTVTADGSIAPGYLYPVEGSGDDIELTMAPMPISDAAEKRLAVKIRADFPGDTLTLTMPGGMLIEGDDGELVDSIDLSQRFANYREWLCDADGNWLLVSWISRE